MAWEWKPSYGICHHCGVCVSLQVASDQHGKYHYRCTHCKHQWMSGHE